MGRFESVAQAPMAGFNLGQASAVQNPLGIAVQQLLSRVNAMQSMQLEHHMKMQYDPAYRFQSKLYGMLEPQLGASMTGAGQTGQVNAEEIMRKTLGLPPSFSYLQGEEQAKETGRLAAQQAGETPLQRAQRESAEATATSTRQKTLEKSRPFGVVRGFFAGTPTSSPQPGGLHITKIEQE